MTGLYRVLLTRKSFGSAEVVPRCHRARLTDRKVFVVPMAVGYLTGLATFKIWWDVVCCDWVWTRV